MEMVALLTLIALLQLTSCVLYGVYLCRYEDDFPGRVVNFFLITIPGLGILFYLVARSGCRKRASKAVPEPGNGSSGW